MNAALAPLHLVEEVPMPHLVEAKFKEPVLPHAAPVSIEIGTKTDGPAMLHVGSLLATRLLIQASSGGGKSWLLRRLLEQSFSMVQQIIIDPEGELVTLADHFDYTVCAPEHADAPISPKSGAQMAHTIFTSGRSAILSLSEFSLSEMQEFVADFLTALLEIPRQHWHHMLLAIDETQLFAPQRDKAVSKKPLIDFSRRARKRGMAPLCACQRISELDKGVAGMLENKLIGLTTLDTDLERAAEALSMRYPQARSLLRTLAPGEFFALGPALGWDVTKVQVGPVATRHGILSTFTGQRVEPTLTDGALQAEIKRLNTEPVKAEDRAPSPCDAADSASVCDGAIDKKLTHLLTEAVQRHAAIQPLLTMERPAHQKDYVAIAQNLKVHAVTVRAWYQAWDSEQGLVSLVDKRGLRHLDGFNQALLKQQAAIFHSVCEG